MDDLHDITDQTYVTAIAQGLDEICGLRVLCVATCRSLGDVNRKLFTEDRFLEQVELPIPDLKARALILSAMLMHAPDAIKGEIPMLSSRTHGCTGRDLARLRRYAERAAERRRMQPLGESHRFSMNGSTYLTCNVSEGLPNGQSDNDVPTTPTSALTIQDFVIALPKLHPSALGEHFSETPKTSWSDIGGSGAMKYRFEKALNWPLKHADILREFNFLPHKGVLLYGPPGCSKTLTAQAVAANYDMNFIAVKGAELVSMYVGESERAVREVFRKARTAKPCIIFFDEIDSIAGERDSGGTKGLNVLTTLLTEMDGFGTTETGVLVLAATNKPWILDPAIMRPGRFDEHIYLPPPDAAARREILNIQIGKLPSEHDLDFSLLVRELGGYTGAEIVSVCRQATQEPIERKVGGQRAFVGMADFERGLRMVKKAVTEVELRKYEAFASPK